VSADPSVERWPSGRRRVPLGVREGGQAWTALHAALAEEALLALADRGYPGMSMDGICLAVGASTRTVYRHYPTKE
jgi:hypothetical protein